MNASTAIAADKATRRAPIAAIRPAVRPTFENEADLVAALRRGDDDAYEELVRRTSPRMLSTARRIVGDEEEARGVVQDAYLAAFRSLGRFAGDAQISTWLHRIVVNTALMKLRSRRRHPETSIEDLLPQFEADGHRRTFELADHRAPDPGAQLDREAARRTVRRCIDALPESYRTILVLRDIEECSTEEVAGLLGLGEGNVKTRLHRARQALRTLLEREGLA